MALSRRPWGIAMNDFVATTRSSAPRPIYEVIAKGAAERDADRVHPHGSPALPRQAYFSDIWLDPAAPVDVNHAIPACRAITG